MRPGLIQSSGYFPVVVMTVLLHWFESLRQTRHETLPARLVPGAVGVTGGVV